LGLPRARVRADRFLSSARLDRLGRSSGDVERGLIPGAVVVIAASGGSACEAFGWRDREAAVPMSVDAIFRIASMTKPITSSGDDAREEGRWRSLRRWRTTAGIRRADVGVERRSRATMTVQDLMRTPRLCYPQFGDSPVQVVWRARTCSTDQTNAELVEN